MEKDDETTFKMDGWYHVTPDAIGRLYHIRNNTKYYPSHRQHCAHRVHFHPGPYGDSAYYGNANTANTPNS
jgi:hypothetical protein